MGPGHTLTGKPSGPQGQGSHLNKTKGNLKVGPLNLRASVHAQRLNILDEIEITNAETPSTRTSQICPCRHRAS